MSEETLAQLREAFEASQKENKKLLTQVESLMKENRTMKAVNAVTEAGLSAELADLFIVANPDADITPEAVTSFAEKYGITASTTEPEEGETNEEQPPPQTDGLANIARAGTRNSGGGSAPSGQKVLTRDEFLTLQEENPVAAQKALAEGRVQLRDDNPLASTKTHRNPFLASRELAT